MYITKNNYCPADTKQHPLIRKVEIRGHNQSERDPLIRNSLNSAIKVGSTFKHEHNFKLH